MYAAPTNESRMRWVRAIRLATRNHQIQLAPAPAGSTPVVPPLLTSPLSGGSSSGTFDGEDDGMDPASILWGPSPGGSSKFRSPFGRRTAPKVVKVSEPPSGADAYPPMGFDM